MVSDGLKTILAFIFIILSLLLCFESRGIEAQAGTLPMDELNALKEIADQLGKRDWDFTLNPCDGNSYWKTPKQSDKQYNNTVNCDCSDPAGVCHVTEITLKGQNLAGVLPPSLAKLPFIKIIDLARNYLSGTIPPEWASTKLESMSLIVNRLSGLIPEYVGNMSTLTYINLQENQFSGTVPSEFGKLMNLTTLILSSNRLTGKLPSTLAELKKLEDFRISDNNFSGPIPDDMIQNWEQLTRLEMIASGLEGPIPSSISLLRNLTDLKISDIIGPSQAFPSLSSATGLKKLVLRNCNISGEIPAYVWRMEVLELFDASFNRLFGEVTSDITARKMDFVFLTGNMLSGNIPDSILGSAKTIDLSYNNFTWQGPDQPTCQKNKNLLVNLFKSSSTGNNLKDALPCMKDISCPRYGCSLHVNCGGDNLRIKESNGEVLYEGDGEADGDAARLYTSGTDWGYSSTGDFMDDNNVVNTRFVETVQSNNIPELYKTARLSPLSLTYFSYCLENGEYAVSLHFAEIQYTNDSTYNSLGRRIFDIYIQEKLVKRRFDIEEEAGGAGRPVIVLFNASVINNVLEIRFYWAGKGTTRIPKTGVYGPLVSAIAVNPYFKTCLSGGKQKKKLAYIAVGVLALCFVFSILFILWWKGQKEEKKR